MPKPVPGLDQANEAYEQIWEREVYFCTTWEWFSQAALTDISNKLWQDVTRMLYYCSSNGNQAAHALQGKIISIIRNKGILNLVLARSKLR